jgi:hypothetical protein
MKIIALPLFLSMILVLSCGSTPEVPVKVPVVEAVQTPPPVQVSPPEPEPEPQAEAVQAPPEREVFSPLSISEDRFAATKAEVQALIEDLNRIIRAKNYNQWIGFLSESYFENIRSPAFLEEKTEELYRRDMTIATNTGKNPRTVQKKILRTARDYFDNVVVPSRQNDHVDDIAFVTENRVKAYTVDTRGNKLVLYDLEIIDGKWKIIN